MKRQGKPEVLNNLVALQIATLFRTSGDTTEKRMSKLMEILDEHYEDGVTFGLSLALEYVTEEPERQRLFKEIDERIEGKKNEC